MTLRLRQARATLVALGVAAAFLSASAPAQADDNLIDAAPVSVVLDTPGPGHATSRDLAATNVSAVSGPLSLRFRGDAVPLLPQMTPTRASASDWSSASWQRISAPLSLRQVASW